MFLLKKLLFIIVIELLVITVLLFKINQAKKDKTEVNQCFPVIACYAK